MLLQDKGLVLMVQGKGTMIAEPAARDIVDDIVLSAVIRQHQQVIRDA